MVASTTQTDRLCEQVSRSLDSFVLHVISESLYSKTPQSANTSLDITLKHAKVSHSNEVSRHSLSTLQLGLHIKSSGIQVIPHAQVPV